MKRKPTIRNENADSDQLGACLEFVLNDLLFIARCYVAAGLSVIPVRCDGSKAPDGRVLPQEFDEKQQDYHSTWKPFQIAQPTNEDLVNWFGGDTLRAIGIPCGIGSGNLEVIDFDAPELWPAWVDLVQTHRPNLFERFVISETPSGGRHVLYRCKQIEGNQKLAMRAVEVPEGTKGAKKDGDRWIVEKTLIETRGQGGQIVAPGSPLCVHFSGKPYKWNQGLPESIPTIKAETRVLLLGLARALNEYEPKEEVRERAEYKKAVRTGGGLRPGDDFSERGDVESVLLDHGWTVSHRRGSIVYLRKPGKRSRNGHNATLHAVAHNWFYCFSTCAAPFDHQRGYSAFQVYALLEHNGDYKAAAKALTEQGYGSQKRAKVILPPILAPVRRPENTIILEPPKRPTDTIQLPKPTRTAATTLLTMEGTR